MFCFGFWLSFCFWFCFGVGLVLFLGSGKAHQFLVHFYKTSLRIGWGRVCWWVGSEFEINYHSNFSRSITSFEKGPNMTKLSHGPKYFGPDLKNIQFSFHRYLEHDELTSLSHVVKDSSEHKCNAET